MLAHLKFRYTTDPARTSNPQRQRKMPKRNAEAYDSDNGFIEDLPSKSKKSKSSTNNKTSNTNTSSTKTPTIKPSSRDLSSSKTANVDENGDKFWPINVPGTRRVTINQFKGKWMVNIREYYDDGGSGVMKPGKKVCHAFQLRTMQAEST